jgi:hypothetical protein
MGVVIKVIGFADQVRAGDKRGQRLMIYLIFFG